MCQFVFLPFVAGPFVHARRIAIRPRAAARAIGRGRVHRAHSGTRWLPRTQQREETRLSGRHL
eukprot:COSAG04_NODE_30991_length_259_cov_0.893750_1_plen_62_part_01